MRYSAAALVMFLLAFSFPALGQEAPSEGPPATSAEGQEEEEGRGDAAEQVSEDEKTLDSSQADPAEGSEESEPSGLADAAEVESYKRGFDAMRAMKWGRAQTLLEAHLKLYPKGPTAAGAMELLLLATALNVQLGNGGSSGRAELVGFSTLYGLWAGIASSLILDLDEGSFLVTFLTGGAGLGLSLMLTSDDKVTAGEAALVSTLGSWGTWNGVGLALVADVDIEPGLGMALGAGVIGIGAAALLNNELSLSSGDVALVSTGGTWGTFFTGMGLLITDADDFMGDKALVGTLLLGSDIGLGVGALMAGRFDVSRGRMRLIDLSGALGTLLAGGLLSIADANEGGPHIGESLSAGAAAGLALGTYFTADWDAPEAGGLALGAPTPFVVPSRKGDKAGATFGLNFLQGSW